MTVTPERPLLPLADPTPSTAPCSSGRAAMTCRYRCGDACAHDAPNVSDNGTFAEVMESALSRRGLLRSGAVLGATTVAGIGLSGSPAAAATRKPGPATTHGKRPKGPKGLRFTPVPPNTADAVIVPPDYAQDVVIR